MTILKDSHHFSRTLGGLWWQSLKTAITSVELWAVFDDNLSWQSLMATLFLKEPFAAAFGKKEVQNLLRQKAVFIHNVISKEKRRCKISCAIWPFFENNFTALCRFTQFISCICTATTFVSWWDAIPGRKLQIGWLVASYREIYNLQCLALNYCFGLKMFRLKTRPL